MRSKELQADDSILKSIKRLALFIWIPIFALIVISDVTSCQNRQNMINITNAMYEFQYVNGIVIDATSGRLEVRQGDIGFNEVKDLLNPFHAGQINIQSSTRMSLQRTSHEQFAEISFLIENNVLLTANVYTFLSRPLMEQSGQVRNGVFMIGRYYAVVLINNGNFLGRFGFHNWNNIEPFSNFGREI